jgi:hypothetical protein
MLYQTAIWIYMKKKEHQQSNYEAIIKYYVIVYLHYLLFLHDFKKQLNKITHVQLYFVLILYPKVK